MNLLHHKSPTVALLLAVPVSVGLTFQPSVVKCFNGKGEGSQTLQSYIVKLLEAINHLSCTKMIKFSIYLPYIVNCGRKGKISPGCDWMSLVTWHSKSLTILMSGSHPLRPQIYALGNSLCGRRCCLTFDSRQSALTQRIWGHKKHNVWTPLRQVQSLY